MVYTFNYNSTDNVFKQTGYVKQFKNAIEWVQLEVRNHNLYIFFKQRNYSY